MKKTIFPHSISKGLVLLALLLICTSSRAQESSGKETAQALENAANKLTSPNAEFHDAVKQVVDAAKQAAEQQNGDAAAVKKAARDKLDREIRKAAGKSYQTELENLRKRWISRELVSVSAADQEASAQEAYENGYNGKTPEKRAESFRKAADLFEKAAEAYRNEGNKEKAESMEGWARAARSNAKTQGPASDAEGKHYYAVQPTGPLGDSSSSTANIPEITVPRFSVSGIGTIPFGRPAPQQIGMTDLQHAVFTPEIMEQLFEKLGGEFFIGDISNPSTQPVEMQGTTQPMPGLQLGIRLGQKFELRAKAQQFRSEWSGSFPVTVFPKNSNNSTAPQTIQGRLHARASGVLAGIDGACFFAKGNFQPFVSAGVRGQFPTQTKSGADIAGVPVQMEVKPVEVQFSPAIGAGMRFVFLGNGFAELGGDYGKIPGGKYAPTVNAGFGWRF